MSCCRTFNEVRTRALSRDEFLPLEDAICAIEKIIRNPEKWLRKNGLIQKLQGFEFVKWGEVVDCIEGKRESPRRKTSSQTRKPTRSRRF